MVPPDNQGSFFLENTNMSIASDHSCTTSYLGVVIVLFHSLVILQDTPALQYIENKETMFAADILFDDQFQPATLQHAPAAVENNREAVHAITAFAKRFSKLSLDD